MFGEKIVVNDWFVFNFLLGLFFEVFDYYVLVLGMMMCYSFLGYYDVFIVR